MSRAINLSMSEPQVREHCRQQGVGISAIEVLASGGVRVVCMSGDGAAKVRRALKTSIIEGAVKRVPAYLSHRPW